MVFLLVCPVFAGCTSGTIPAAKKSSPHVRAWPTSTQSSAPANDDVTPPTLSGSFVMDLTWVSDTAGWALAASHCSEGLCPQVARTRDGGATWERLPPPPASIQNGYVDCARQACVTNIRFASPSVGYLFGPALLLTSDGGRTWVRETGLPVEDLEPGAGSVLRLVYDHDGCPGPCRRTLQQAAAGSNDWRTLRSFGALAAGSARLIRAGTAVYVPIYGNPAWGAGDQHAVILRSLDAGSTWRQLKDPCGGSSAAVYDAIAFAAAPGGSLAALCLSRFEGAVRFLLTSNDNGATWGVRHPVPGFAHVAQMIAVTIAHDLVIASGTGGGSGPFTYRLAISTDGGLHWSTRITDPQQLDPTAPDASSGGFLGFQNATVGRWVGDKQAIWTTQDGGEHWIRQNFP